MISHVPPFLVSQSPTGFEQINQAHSRPIYGRVSLAEKGAAAVVSARPVLRACRHGARKDARLFWQAGLQRLRFSCSYILNFTFLSRRD